MLVNATYLTKLRLGLNLYAQTYSNEVFIPFNNIFNLQLNPPSPILSTICLEMYV